MARMFADVAEATLERTDLRGIPWLLIMELTLQPGAIWKNVPYDLSPEQGDPAQMKNVEKPNRLSFPLRVASLTFQQEVWYKYDNNKKNISGALGGEDIYIPQPDMPLLFRLFLTFSGNNGLSFT